MACSGACQGNFPRYLFASCVSVGILLLRLTTLPEGWSSWRSWSDSELLDSTISQKSQLAASPPTTTAWGIEAGCAENYNDQRGDVPGWGRVNGKGGGDKVTNCQECADMCSAESVCGSYECSFTSLGCSLNREHDSKGKQYGDYLLCQKVKWFRELPRPRRSQRKRLPAKPTTTTVRSTTKPPPLTLLTNNGTSSAIVPLRAVIVDPLWDAHLETILVNYLTVLDPSIPIRWYYDHRTVNWTDKIKSPVIKAAVRNKRLDAFPFKQRITKLTYNELRMHVYFYNSINAEHALMFERDTVLCGGSPNKVAHFLNFDYIGAPWPPRVSWCHRLAPYLCCCNSGLSMVNTKQMIRVLGEYHLDEFGHQNDMYLLQFRRQRKNVRNDFTFGERKDGLKFSVEAIWDGKEVPFGVHKPWWGYAEFRTVDMKQLHLACPEISLLCPYARARVGLITRSGGRHVAAFINEVCNQNR